MDWLTSPEAWIALVTLTVLEIVLGIDNIVFISILAGKLPAGDQQRARRLGLTLAMFTRILLLLSITWVMRLTAPLFTLVGRDFSGRDLILFVGGLFLLWKSTREIHDSLEGPEREGARQGKGVAGFGGVLVQIALLDIVFSLDSVITAVGMARHGYDLSLASDRDGWRATFLHRSHLMQPWIGQVLTWCTTPWQAVQEAAWRAINAFPVEDCSVVDESPL